MITALLILIFFAILFPAALRLLFVLLFIGVLAVVIWGARDKSLTKDRVQDEVKDPAPITLGMFMGACRIKFFKGVNDCDPKVMYVLLPNGRSLVTFIKDDTMF